MSDEKNDLSRRQALKGIAVGVSLPILGQRVLADEETHAHNHGGQTAKPAPKKAAAPKFFTAKEMATVSVISELIIPTDDHSPGAIAAEVPAFIDLMVSEAPAETKQLWRDGLAAVDKKADGDFAKAAQDKQIAVLTEISKNEAKPQALEERFFRAVKNMTIDGYYTSEIGIKKELRYKGNTYLKEFKGCTHPEHQS
ncbi:MAG TPA: gluconate 2-dehydrogenase subunit 3 family protein [Blastocatellia bacterium]|nr:gluconate 2-dehydrogenase subunit 3 family protein [Blastocatellia bacterium]